MFNQNSPIEIIRAKVGDAHASGRQGLGSLLLSRVVSDCIQNGFRSMITWVAEKNKYRYFYEFYGAIFLPLRKIEKFGESEIVEVSYGWNDLQILERRLTANRQQWTKNFF